jgi:hypothetical protein
MTSKEVLLASMSARWRVCDTLSGASQAFVIAARYCPDVKVLAPQ